jgi:hypothetical protein
VGSVMETLFVGEGVRHTWGVRRHLLACSLAWLGVACGGGEEDPEAGVGGSRDSCCAPDSHSELLSEHSCACEPGYDWCSDAITEFNCCPNASSEDDGAPSPDAPCDETLAEQLLCVPEGDDPSASVVWACNAERWVEVPGYPTFACLADNFPFAYGCAEGPLFLCGHGPGSACEPEGYSSVCVNADVIDTCVWGRRTVDYCSRLCGELEVFGPGYASGTCEAIGTDPATCVCS